MKALFLRELRRLLPYGLLAPLAALGGELWVAAASGGQEAGALAAAGLALLPGLLGVALVAPDTVSGAGAFLGCLPLRPARLLATRLLAALTWLLAGAALLLPLATGSLGWVHAVALPFGLGCGLLASVVANRTLTALVCAPIIGLAVALAAVALPVLTLGITPPGEGTQEVFLGILAALGLAAVGAAFAGHGWGDRQRRSLRPAAIGVSALAVCVLTSVALTTAAHAYTSATIVPRLTVDPRGVARSERHLVLPLWGLLWTGQEQRLCLVDRASGEPWLLPLQDVSGVQLDPSGRRLLVRRVHGAGGWLVDIAARRLEPLQPSASTRFGLGAAQVVWRDDGPLLVALRGGRLDLHDPRTGAHTSLTLDPPGGHELLLDAVGVDPAGRLLATDREGVGVWALDGLAQLDGLRPPATPEARVPTLLFAWPAGAPQYGDLTLSPRGRWLLAKTIEGVHLYALDSGRRAPVPAPEALEVARARGALAFDPTERHLLLERPGAEVVLCDLAAGSARRLPLAPADAASPRPRSGLRPEWGPDGSWVTLASGLRLDVERWSLGADPATRDVTPPGGVLTWLADGAAVRCTETGRLQIGRPGAWRPLLGPGGAR